MPVMSAFFMRAETRSQKHAQAKGNYSPGPAAGLLGRLRSRTIRTPAAFRAGESVCSRQTETCALMVPAMSRRFRIAGINFDHFHMGDLLRMVHDHPEAEIVGICDENSERMREA